MEPFNESCRKTELKYRKDIFYYKAEKARDVLRLFFWHNILYNHTEEKGDLYMATKRMVKRRRRQQVLRRRLILLSAVIILFALAIAIAIIRYAPTNEHMALDEYYLLHNEDAEAVVINGSYIKEEEEDVPYAISHEKQSYLQIAFVKENLDDGYVYDYTGNILRYATDKQLVTAHAGDNSYTIGRETIVLEGPSIIVEKYGKQYLRVDFVNQFTDFKYATFEQPGRVIIEKAGYEKTVATLKKDTAVRRFGGPKSKILKDATAGEKITVLENHGKWSSIITGDGVIGCVRNRHIIDKKEQTVAAQLEERQYNHIQMEYPIKLGWHQMLNTNANAAVSEVLNSAPGMNVLSPTWFNLSDNNGNIQNLSDSNYVTTCHAAGVQVWALVSNVNDDKVDTGAVLDSVSARDNLVNNLISAALSVGLDGINVDIESLNEESKDGFIQFIRELSLHCESNGLVLSVDNYKPTPISAFYNRKEQAKYADYIVVMAYDEFYSGSETAGPTASLNYIVEATEGTLAEVPKEQIIMGLPFYTRLWRTGNGELSTKAIGMEKIPELLSEHNAQKQWQEDLGLNYAEYSQGDDVYKIWIEDEKSFEKKLAVVKENDLAGAAFWKLGFEPRSVWELIQKYVH